MRAFEFLTEEVGRVIDLTKNYPHYSTLKGKILDISPKGKYKIQIIDADIIPGKKVSVKVGDTVAINANYLRQARRIDESTTVRLKDLATVSTDSPEADFWIIRKGSEKTVGTPVKQYQPQYIGVKVVKTNVLEPNYLYYMIMHLHNQGYFKSRAIGITNLVNIRVADVADISFGLQEGINEDWKKTLGGIAAAGALALPGNMMHKPGTDQLPPVAVEPVAVEKADPAVVKQAAASMATPIGQVLKRAAATIKNKAERAQFLAQCAHETLNFSTLKEKGGTLDFRKYDLRFNPSKARALGNDKPGDGARYAGRGYIQLTGKANYQKAGDELGIPLEKHPQLAERPDVAAQVALWYWHHRVTPKVSNFNNTKAVTKPINSHLNGLEDRHQKYLAFSELLGNNNAPSQGLNEHDMDNTDGWGATPINGNVDYMGLRVMMRPSTFLKLALPLKEPKSSADIIKHIEQGGHIASPFLILEIPAEWDDGDFSKPARITGHEGRNRMIALQELEENQPQEVHIFPQGLRNKHMTPEFIKNMNNQLIPERQEQPISGPFWSDVLNARAK